MAGFSGSGAERRRRVLNEPAVTPGDADAESAKPARKVAAAAQRPASYPPEVLAQLPRLSDLVARRYSTLACWSLLGVTVVAALETAYAYQSEIAKFVAAPQLLRVLDLSAASSVAAWFCSFTFALAAAGSLAIYSIRRHKADDYQGRYRVWLSAAGCWFVLSINSTVGLDRVAAALGPKLSGWGHWAGGALWWLVPGVLAVGTVVARLILELRPCRAAVVTLLLTVGCWAAALAISLGWPPLAQAELAVLVASGAAMAGHLLLLITLGLFARHVVLEAEGLIVVAEKQPRPARKKKAASSAPAAGDKKEKPAASKPARTRRAKAEPAVEQVASNEADQNSSKPPAASEPKLSAWTDGSEGAGDEFDDAPNRKLSKAERRRLRKLRTQQNRAA